MKEMRSPPKDVRFVVALEPETLPQMNVSDARLQCGKLASFRFRAIGEFHRISAPRRMGRESDGLW